MLKLKTAGIHLPDGKSQKNPSLVRDKIYGELHSKVNTQLYIKSDCNINSIAIHGIVWESIELPILRHVWRQLRNQISDAADDKIKKKFEKK